MYKHIKKLSAIIMVAALLIVYALPCVSAATLLDTSKTVSVSLKCAKTGYTFELYKVGTLDTNSTSPYETKYTSLVPSISSSVLNGDTTGILKALDALTTVPSSAPSQGTWTTTATSTTKTFSNLAQGIYYVKAVNYPAGVTSVTNSVVALPYYNNSWVYSIGAIDLATKVVDDTPTTHKEITNSTKNNVNFTDVSLGDTVNFEIKSTTAGSNTMHLGSYVVSDDMSAGLTLDQSSFNVAIEKSDGTKITDLDASEYKVNIVSSGEGKNTVFNVALTSAYLDTAEFYGTDVKYTSVTYSAVLNKYAVVGVAGNPNTEPNLEYSNKNGVTSTVDGNTVYVYTYAATTNKFDTEGNKLSGAEFALYTTETDATVQKNAIATGISDKDGKVLYYNAKGEEIKLQSGTYYVMETKAPTGYNLYGKVITVSINATYGTVLNNGTYVTNCPENGYATIDVKDSKVTLPLTGGAGTVAIYFVGVICLGCAIALFVVAKHRNTSK